MDTTNSLPRPSSFSGTSNGGGSFAGDRPPQHQRPHTSRFIEGSMSDRASHAPPVSFRSIDHVEDNPFAQRQHHDNTRRSLQLARPSLSSFRTTWSSSGSSTAASAPETAASVATTDTDGSMGSSTSGTRNLSRPRSFLGPLWHGVTKRLHRRSRSTVEVDVAVSYQQRQQQQQHSETPLRPSPDEVLANYQQLMQSGFFQQRAIPATRQGLTHGDGDGDRTAAVPPSSSKPGIVVAASPRGHRGISSSRKMLSMGTSLSPVAPSPASTFLVTATPRGIKRNRNENADTEGAANVENADDADDADDGPCRELHGLRSCTADLALTDKATPSPSRTPRKLTKKLRKSSSRLPGGETLRSAAANESFSCRLAAAQGDASLSMSTPTSRAPVPANQPEQHLSASTSSVMSPLAYDVPEAESASDRPPSKRRKESAVTYLEGHVERQVCRSVAGAETSNMNEASVRDGRKKRHSHGPAAVVHQGGPDDEVATPHAATPSDRPRRPDGHKPGQLLGSQSSSPLRPEIPMSFHYPQRVRVRRPMQAAQVVEVKSLSLSATNRQRNASASHGPRALSQSALASRTGNAKPLLFQEGNEENQPPVWQS